MGIALAQIVYVVSVALCVLLIAYCFIVTTARTLFWLYFAAKLDHHKKVIRELKPSRSEH